MKPCDVCNTTGIGPDGSYCREKDCEMRDYAQWKDQAWELAEVIQTLQTQRYSDLTNYQQLQREYWDLKFQFQKYGRHHRRCTKQPCSCGFDKVRIQGVRQ